MLTYSFILVFCLFLLIFNKLNALSLTKLIPIWLFILLVSGLMINAIFTNLVLIEKPVTVDHFIAFHIFQKLLLPGVMILLMNLFSLLVSPLKWGTTILGALIFMLFEKIVEQIGIIEYKHWNIGFSALFWFTFTLLSIAFFALLNSKRWNGGNQHV
ncbi:hypothetical protein J27TS8_31900 [Robertmurraya siralis]|uniref:Uncharacterized protein n=1 Tax=Robertmurraya siralis TaxID=77777 RepID=A0A919WK47_9BACI|nr:hypothetical protein [Robertmurraya siralis]GIN63197.1 hypothetical protein J27TS8_31900 [Robertmurraya siralis]